MSIVPVGPYDDENPPRTAFERVYYWALREEDVLRDGGYAAGDASGGPDPEDVLQIVRLLYECYSGFSAIIRRAFPLDPSWPTEPDGAFEKLGEELYPAGPPEKVETLGDLVLELLTSFSAYITAWEAKCPWSSDGEDLARRMKEALGLPAHWDEEPPR